MVQTPKSELARAALLEAAGNLVASRGALLLTLDAVAKDAGISKGGLLHHFPTKEALLVALADREVQNYRTLLAHLCVTAQSIGLQLDRASAHLMMGYLQSLGSDVCNVRTDILAGMMPAISVTPELAQHISGFYQSLFADVKKEKSLTSGASFADVATRILAAEGWFMLQLHGVLVFSKEDEMQMLGGLIQGLGIPEEKIMQLLLVLDPLKTTSKVGQQ